MMQKIINLMAVTSFAVSAGIVAGGLVFYHNREDIQKEIQDNIIEGVTEVIPEIVKESIGSIEVPNPIPFYK